MDFSHCSGSVCQQVRSTLCGSSASLELYRSGLQLVTVTTVRVTALVNCPSVEEAEVSSWAHSVHRCLKMDASRGQAIAICGH